jgi:hypothetical protein
MTDPLEPAQRMTDYIRDDVLVKRPYIRLEWCAAAIEHPIRSEVQLEDQRFDTGYSSLSWGII